MTQRPLIVTILITISLFLVGGILLSFLFSLIGGLLWLALKVLLPLAFVIWLVRLIVGPSNHRRYY